MAPNSLSHSSKRSNNLLHPYRNSKSHKYKVVKSKPNKPDSPRDTRFSLRLAKMTPGTGPLWGSGKPDILSRMPLEVKSIIYHSLYSDNRFDLLSLAMTCKGRYQEIIETEYPASGMNASMDRQFFRLVMPDRRVRKLPESGAQKGSGAARRHFFPVNKDFDDDTLVLLDWVGIGPGKQDRRVSVSSVKGLKHIHFEISEDWHCARRSKSVFLRKILDVLFEAFSTIACRDGPMVTMQTANSPWQFKVAGHDWMVARSPIEEKARQYHLWQSIKEVSSHDRYPWKGYCYERRRCLTPAGFLDTIKKFLWMSE